MALFSKKKKEDVEPKQYIFADSIVYDDQKLNFGQKVTVFIVAFLLGAVVGYIFYQNIFIAIIAGAIAGIIAIPAWTKRTIRKRKEKLSMQFRDLLESLSTSIGAGNTIPMAFADAREDIANQYSDSCDMVKEIDNIIGGMAMNINIEELLLDFGERSGITDIMSFAVVFDHCHRHFF